jgi:hypothetical protein
VPGISIHKKIQQDLRNSKYLPEGTTGKEFRTMGENGPEKPLPTALELRRAEDSPTTTTSSSRAGGGFEVAPNEKIGELK